MPRLAFEGLELSDRKLSRSVLRGLGVSNDPRLPGMFWAAFLFLNFNLLSADAKLPELPKAADTSVDGIYIGDPESSVRVLGSEIKLIESRSDFPHVNVLNKDKTQVLVLIFHPGGVRNSFNEFRVSSVDPAFSEKACHLKKVVSFRTGKNILLGISKEKVVSILGDGFQEKSEGKVNIVKYVIDNFNNSSFLKFYNMPIYYGEYQFRNNKLMKFSFGFEYP